MEGESGDEWVGGRDWRWEGGMGMKREMGGRHGVQVEGSGRGGGGRGRKRGSGWEGGPSEGKEKGAGERAYTMSLPTHSCFLEEMVQFTPWLESVTEFMNIHFPIANTQEPQILDYVLAEHFLPSLVFIKQMKQPL